MLLGPSTPALTGTAATYIEHIWLQILRTQANSLSHFVTPLLFHYRTESMGRQPHPCRSPEARESRKRETQANAGTTFCVTCRAPSQRERSKEKHETVTAGAGPRRNTAAGPRQQAERPAAEQTRGSRADNAGDRQRRRKRIEPTFRVTCGTPS